MNLTIIILSLIINTIVLGQSFELKYKWGNFSQTSSFSFSPSGYLYLSDISKNEIYKFDTTGSLIVSIGGFGWANSEFDQPIDVFATTLHVYVSDKNNDRIQIFDKDLNFLSYFTTRDSENQRYAFSYPTSSAVSPQGDLYILDSDNSRILKYNLNGEFKQEIGSFDAGSFALSNPKRFAVSQDNKIFVTDAKTIVVFDQYGNGLLKINSDLPDANINITYNHLVVNDADIIKIFDLTSSRISFRQFHPEIPIDESIVEAAVFTSMLFVLTTKSIYLYDYSE